MLLVVVVTVVVVVVAIVVVVRILVVALTEPPAPLCERKQSVLVISLVSESGKVALEIYNKTYYKYYKLLLNRGNCIQRN